MIWLILLLQVLLLVAVLLLFPRKPPVTETPAVDARQAQLPEQVALLHGRHEAHDTNLRAGLMDVRRESALAAEAAREANARGLRDTADRSDGHYRQAGRYPADGTRKFQDRAGEFQDRQPRVWGQAGGRCAHAARGDCRAAAARPGRRSGTRRRGSGGAAYAAAGARRPQQGPGRTAARDRAGAAGCAEHGKYRQAGRNAPDGRRKAARNAA